VTSNIKIPVFTRVFDDLEVAICNLKIEVCLGTQTKAGDPNESPAP
jgi:hypothetical protein